MPKDARKAGRISIQAETMLPLVSSMEKLSALSTKISAGIRESALSAIADINEASLAFFKPDKLLAASDGQEEASNLFSSLLKK